MRPDSRRPAQALMEFALVISMFTLVMLALFDWARVFGTYISMTNATREAARQAQVVTRTFNPMSAAQAQGVVNTAMTSYTLALGPGQFTTAGGNPADVCVFPSGTILSATTTDPCNSAANGGNTPAATATSGTGAV